jgi:hypothetical protein
MLILTNFMACSIVELLLLNFHQLYQKLIKLIGSGNNNCSVLYTVLLKRSALEVIIWCIAYIHALPPLVMEKFKNIWSLSPHPIWLFTV